MVTIKQLLSTIVKTIKDEHKYTYDDIINKVGGIINKTQLTRILVKDGKGVSCTVIHEVISKLDYNMEIEVYNKVSNEYL